MEKLKWFLVFATNPVMTVSLACQIVARMLESYCREARQYGLPWMIAQSHRFRNRG